MMWSCRLPLILGPDWEGGVAVYLPELGKTLAVSALGALVLKTLAASDAGLTREAVESAVLTDDRAAGIDPEMLSHALEAIFRDFSAIGLIHSD